MALPKETGLATAAAWAPRANAGYERLGWVSAPGPLTKMVELAALRGHETVVDAATGSGAILDALAPKLNRGGRIIGFDISRDMMSRRPNPLPANAELREASIYDTGFSTNSADVVTARQVFHNLSDIDGAVQELGRVVKPGGKMTVCEYVAVDEAVRIFEDPIFQTKEEGRHLWTGEQMARVIGTPWFEDYPDATVELHYALMPQYSVRDWMASSSLPPEVQEQIVRRYVEAPVDIKERMSITVTNDGDALVDRPFAFIVANKPHSYDDQAA